MGTKKNTWRSPERLALEARHVRMAHAEKLIAALPDKHKPPTVYACWKCGNQRCAHMVYGTGPIEGRVMFCFNCNPGYERALAIFDGLG